jgi:hypothetical protein
MSLILDPKDDTCMGPCIHIKYSMVHKSGGFTKQNPHKKQAACISNPTASTKHKQIARPLKSRSRSMAGRLRSFPDPVHMREGSCQARSRALGSGHVKRASTYPSVRPSFHFTHSLHPMLQQHRQALSMARQTRQTIAKREIRSPAAGF